MSDMRIGGCPVCGGYTENDCDPRCMTCNSGRPKPQPKRASCPDCLALAKTMRAMFLEDPATPTLFVKFLDAFIKERER